MNQTPLEFKKLADSVELYDQVELIGSKFGLHIDQIGELDAEIRDILNGVSESSDFTKHIIERLEIDRSLADKIVLETNKAIFETLKKQIQNQASPSELPVPSPTATPATNTTLERVGNFSIEPTIGEGSDGSTGPGTHWKEVTAADRNKILAGVEDPGKLGGTSSSSRSEESHAEPIVDYLLQNSVGQRERTDVVSHTHASAAPPTNLPVVETTPVTAKSTPPVKTPVAPPRSGPDPYHEPVA